MIVMRHSKTIFSGRVFHGIKIALQNQEIKHSIIQHKEQYADRDTHTNTIEGFWSLLKKAWYGLHHLYSTEYTPVYVAEQCYKYNYREENIFDKFLRESVES